MNPTLHDLEIKLTELETRIDANDYTISSDLRKLRDGTANGEPPREWTLEVAAFSFMEDYDDKSTGWGTYYGPLMVWRTDSGDTLEYPSFREIDKAAIDYWSNRSQRTANPRLRARYAGLVWELSEPATGEKASYVFAEDHCRALLMIANSHHDKLNADAIKKAERALSVALSINNSELIESAKETILNLERFATEHNNEGLWGFSFDLLVMNKRTRLTNNEEQEVIRLLEEQLSHCSGGDSWTCEPAAARLASYYQSRGRPKDLERVIDVLGAAFEESAENATPLTASLWLEHIHKVYLQYNRKDDAERVAQTIRSLGPRIRDSMQTFTHEMNVPRTEFETYVNEMVSGEIEVVLLRLAVHHIPSKSEIANQLHELAKKAPLSFLINKQLIDDSGRVLAQVGPLQEDLDGNIVAQMSQNMVFTAGFLSSVIERVVEEFSLNSDTLTAYITRSPVFDSSRYSLISRAISEYLKDDHVTFIHVIVPQIEAALRSLSEQIGANIFKPRRGGGFQLVTLDELLRNNELQGVFGEDVILYLRVLLTDQRGWNVRNNVAHGLLSEAEFSRLVSDRLIHVLLLLAQVAEKTGASTD